jgi:integrase/recombinase XerD
MWDVYKKGFRAFLQLEKSLSENSVEAYLHDMDKFTQFLSISNPEITPKEIELHHMEKF